jgi:hypothetical protein
MTGKTGRQASPKRRAYRVPKLKTHGDLRRVVRAKGGSQSDGAGKPKTKAGPGPG